MNYASGIARKYRFDSKIEILAVKDKELFRILSQYEQDLLGYKISYLEIAGDTSCSGKDESIVASELLMKSAVKTYTSTGTLFDVARQSKKRISLLRGKVDKEIFSGRTLYLGGKHFKFVIYPRQSKLTGSPSDHREFRIVGSSNIRLKTKISRIEDFLTFDVEKWFREREQKYIKLKRINHKKHGEFLLAPLRPKIKPFGAYVYDPAVGASMAFVRYLMYYPKGKPKIETSAQFIKFYVDLLEKSKKKSAGEKKSPWEIKIAALTRKKINDFLSPI
ncbi:MAG: hypothetical protein HY202_04710 [Nitrospirae bacterium]|nr:hypothetical protein [Nitrospirota bacterium]